MVARLAPPFGLSRPVPESFARSAAHERSGARRSARPPPTPVPAPPHQRQRGSRQRRLRARGPLRPRWRPCRLRTHAAHSAPRRSRTWQVVSLADACLRLVVSSTLRQPASSRSRRPHLREERRANPDREPRQRARAPRGVPAHRVPRTPRAPHRAPRASRPLVVRLPPPARTAERGGSLDRAGRQGRARERYVRSHQHSHEPPPARLRRREPPRPRATHAPAYASRGRRRSRSARARARTARSAEQREGAIRHDGTTRTGGGSRKHLTSAQVDKRVHMPIARQQ